MTPHLTRAEWANKALEIYNPTGHGLAPYSGIEKDDGVAQGLDGHSHSSKLCKKTPDK